MAIITLLLSFACAVSLADALCVHIVCVETFQPWAPQLSHGQCKVQVAKAINTVRTFVKPHSCPANVHCKGKHKARFACSCRELQDCQWLSWESWAGSLLDGTCAQQTRRRVANPTYRYKEVVGGCGNVVTSCPRSEQTEGRRRCKCRKANNCQLHQWTAWAGTVPEGGCAVQTSTQPVTPHYTFDEQPDNCNSVNGDCPSPRTRTQTSCKCRSKVCAQQEWTQWSLIQVNGPACPKEERTRSYTFTLTHLDALNNCNNIGVKSCPQTQGMERQKDIKCPRLTAPQHGSLLNGACDGASSSCGATCSFNCHKGFSLVGKNYVTCGKNRQWDDNAPVCRDSVNPIISCPNATRWPNDPNTNYATIQLTMANATDNVGVASVQTNVTSPIRVFVGTPVKVAYTASDAAGNTARCTTDYIAEDKEPPKVVECPNDTERDLAHGRITVTWKEPVFDDNVEGKHVDRWSVPLNGQKHGLGKHKVVYTAQDKAGNKATCEFDINIKSPSNLCEVYNTPKNGTMVCNNKKQGQTQSYICGVACDKGFGFAKTSAVAKVYDFYLCSGVGQWNGAGGMPPVLKPLVRGSRPWPDCSKNYPADAVTKHFVISAGPCNAQKTKEQLKKEFSEKMKSDTMISFMFCTSSKCEIDDISVTCSTSRKRSSPTLTISFDMVVIPDIPPLPPAPQGRTFMSSDDMKRIEEMIKKQIQLEIQRLTQYLKRLQEQIKLIMAHILRINAHLLKITSSAAYVGCPKGSTMSMVGQPPKKLCTKCPVGTFFNEGTKVCDSCQPGSYQDDEGKVYCKACPAGTTSSDTAASVMNDCRAVCRPGTHSRSGDGLATCLVCAKGSYQPGYRQSSCIRCPGGKTTATYGSTSITDCK